MWLILQQPNPEQMKRPRHVRCNSSLYCLSWNVSIKHITISVLAMTSNTLSCFRVSLIYLSFSGHMSGQVPTNTLDMSRSVLLGRPVWTYNTHSRCLPCFSATVMAASDQCDSWLHLDAGSCLSAPGSGTCPQWSRQTGQWGAAGRRGRGALSLGPLCWFLSVVHRQTEETLAVTTSSLENWHMKDTCKMVTILKAS